MNIYDVAELTEVMADYWLSLDGWSANESTYLLLAIDPLKLKSAVGFNGGKLEVNLPNQFDALEKMVSTAFKTGASKSPLAAPKDVIAWAMEKKLRLPASLIPADMVVKDESGVIKDYSVPSKMAREGVRTTSDLPTFNMPARPADVPQWLRDLPPYAGVHFINNVGGRSMHGPVEAKGVIELVEDAITRQATGFFTLNEAAQVLADSRLNLKAHAMIDLMRKAWKDDKLPIRDSSHNGPVSGARSISVGTDLLSLQDINSWLTSEGMGYQFPQATQPLVGSEFGNVPNSAVLIQRAVAWRLKTSTKRFPGYRQALYEFLKNEHVAGKAIPKARDVLNAWKTASPREIQVMTDGVKYNDGKGNLKEADLKAIQQAILRLVDK
jgi:hypothetical protein